ncbi:hypothetical protein RHGRI_003136 [Rhododendron griersonianum]|uniref:Uncharacterized protein n=1 Tax=Rhododendron griersonianum TaxID=479676 RepID=A0AAV6LRR5_9ERIC|nr:hypothetical protein RHGRI_003136 [Rhododendron griersonianum]
MSGQRWWRQSRWSGPVVGNSLSDCDMIPFHVFSDNLHSLDIELHTMEVGNLDVGRLEALYSVYLLFFVFHFSSEMGGLPSKNPSSTITLSSSQKDQGPTITTSVPDARPKKICCACPDTKKLRDECVVEHGEAAC